MLKAVGTILTMIVALIVIGVLGFMWWTAQAQNNQLAKALKAAGTATVAAGQAQATTDATRIVVAGERRDSLAITLHQENADAIAKAPGAGAPADPGVWNTARDRLCLHDAYRYDPGCAGLRQPDPAVVPPADPASAAAAAGAGPGPLESGGSVAPE